MSVKRLVFLVFYLFVCSLPSFSSGEEESSGYQQASIYLSEGDYQQACRELKLFLEIHPDSSRGHNNLGFCYYKLNKWGLAIEEYKKAIALDPLYAVANNNLGIIAYHQKNYELAKIYFQRAVSLNDRYAKVMFNLALVYYKLGEKKNARAMLDKARQTDKIYVKTRIEEAKKKIIDKEQH
jgi:Tfp pilus assembly protein PilF